MYDDFSESLAALSVYFAGDTSLSETLERVAELTLKAVGSAAFAGITMIVEGQERTAVFTDQRSPELDQAQYDTNSGPCVDAFHVGEIFTIDDTRTESRWPEFCRAADAAGIRSMLSLPLSVNGGTVGALNLYAVAPESFPLEVRDRAAQFAMPAAVVLANAQAYWDARQLSARLSDAMSFRAVIEQAKGVLIAAQGCTADEAFDLLVKASQRENIKLREIASRIVGRASSGTSVDGDEG